MSKEHLERVRRSFATQADWYAGPVLPLTTEALNDWIRDSLPRGGVEVALDVAAGTGVLSRTVAPFAEQVVALDATPEMIRKGRQMTEREGIANIRFEEGLAEAIPYPDGSFDLVVSRLGFHHFQNANEAMDEMVRVCKQAGVIGVVDMISDQDPRTADVQTGLERLRDPSHMRCLTGNELVELFRIRGMSDVRTLMSEQTKTLEEWLAATETPPEPRGEIESAVRSELAGGAPTGMYPFVEAGEPHIRQRLIFVSGTRGAG